MSEQPSAAPVLRVTFDAISGYRYFADDVELFPATYAAERVKGLRELVKDLREREGRNKKSAHPSLQGFAEGAGYAADHLEAILAQLEREGAPGPSIDDIMNGKAKLE